MICWSGHFQAILSLGVVGHLDEQALEPLVLVTLEEWHLLFSFAAGYSRPGLARPGGEEPAIESWLTRFCWAICVEQGGRPVRERQLFPRRASLDRRTISCQHRIEPCSDMQPVGARVHRDDDLLDRVGSSMQIVDVGQVTDQAPEPPVAVGDDDLQAGDRGQPSDQRMKSRVEVTGLRPDHGRARVDAGYRARRCVLVDHLESFRSFRAHAPGANRSSRSRA